MISNDARTLRRRKKTQKIHTHPHPHTHTKKKTGKRIVPNVYINKHSSYIYEPTNVLKFYQNYIVTKKNTTLYLKKKEKKGDNVQESMNVVFHLCKV